MNQHPSVRWERSPFRFGRRALVIDMIVWTVAGLGFTAFGILNAANPVTVQWVAERAGFHLLGSFFWAALTPLIFWIAHRWGIDGPHPVMRILALAGLGFPCCIAMLVLGGDLPRWILDIESRTGGEFSVLNTLRNGWFLGAYSVYAAILAAGLAREYFSRYQERTEEAIRLETEKARIEAERARIEAKAARIEATGAELKRELAEARIELLRSKLNPHFLFNTLNGMAALTERDPRAARRMLALLSDILRSALEPSPQEEVPLGEELRLTGQYLELLEIRYQGQLETLVSAEPEIMDGLVPGAILQPLVENSVKHAVEKAGGHGRIEVTARRAGESLILSVRDTGSGCAADGVSASSPGLAGWGIGLEYTRTRLEELYGSSHGFELRAVGAGGTIAEIVLPYHTRAELFHAPEITPA